jgi:hypothetical protein
MHSRPLSLEALDGMRLVYRPVVERVRPTQLGLARLAAARPRRMAQAFAAFCRGYIGPRSPFAGGRRATAG